MGNSSSTNILQQTIRQRIERVNAVTSTDDVEHHQTWTVDASMDQLRHVIGSAFAGTKSIRGEPTFTWALNHTNVTDAVRTQWIRFVLTFSALEDMIQTNYFQLCCCKAAGIDENTQETTNDNTTSTSSSEGVVTTTAVKDNSNNNNIIAFATVQEYDAVKRRAYHSGILGTLRRKWHYCVSFCKVLFVYKEPIPSLFMENDRKADAQAFGDKLGDFEERCDVIHQQVMIDAGVHWYVHMIGVNPLYHGTGYGKLLLNRLTGLADESNTVLYLEAGHTNQTFYEKYGFVTVRTERFKSKNKDDTDTFMVYFMTRTPSAVVEE